MVPGATALISPGSGWNNARQYDHSRIYRYKPSSASGRDVRQSTVVRPLGVPCLDRADVPQLELRVPPRQDLRLSIFTILLLHASTHGIACRWLEVRVRGAAARHAKMNTTAIGAVFHPLIENPNRKGRHEGVRSGQSMGSN